MQTTIQIRAEELNERILSGIRELFKGKKIAISIAEVVESEGGDDTEYLMREDANRYHLNRAIADIETGQDLLFFTPEEFEQFIHEKGGVQ